jgi:hypothetical protein
VQACCKHSKRAVDAWQPQLRAVKKLHLSSKVVRCSCCCVCSTLGVFPCTVAAESPCVQCSGSSMQSRRRMCFEMSRQVRRHNAAYATAATIYAWTDAWTDLTCTYVLLCQQAAAGCEPHHVPCQQLSCTAACIHARQPRQPCRITNAKSLNEGYASSCRRCCCMRLVK